MKTVIYKCDVCGYTKEGEESPLILGKVGVTTGANYEEIKKFKELCPECRRKAVKELYTFLQNNQYFQSF